MSTALRRPGVALGLALALACVTLPAGPVASSSAAGPVAAEPTTSIVVTGVPTDGHTFHAYRIATYADVTTVGGLPTDFVLATSTPQLKAVLGPEVAALEDARNGAVPAPAVDAAGDVDGMDPLEWVARHWSPQPGASDRWGNPFDLLGPLRDLADWLGMTLNADAASLGLTATQVTGSRAPGAAVSTASFPALAPGLYALAHPHPQSQYGTPVPGTHSPTLLIGTKIPVGGRFLDLYGADGAVRTTLGAADVKGDGVAITKTLDDPTKAASPTFAVGDAVAMRISTTLPFYDLFPAASTLRAEITDTHSAGLGLPDWQGTDARLAEPVVTVGTQTLRFDEGCVVGAANTSDACYGVSAAAAAPDGTTSWTVSLPSWVVRAHGGDVVVLTYEQLLVADARSSVSVNGTVGTADTNRASITFSNNPAMADDVGTATSADVTVFTFPLRLTKVDAGTRAPLAGVAFSVTTGATRHCFARAADGAWWHAGTAPCAPSETSAPTTAADGALVLNGLAGDVAYTVAEVTAPTGFDPKNAGLVRFTARAVPTFAPGDAPGAVTGLTYRYASIGTARDLGTFLTTTAGSTTVPTAAGTAHQPVLTEQVTVLNWRTVPATALARTGADVGQAVLGAALLVAAGVFVALAARRRRRITGSVAR